MNTQPTNSTNKPDNLRRWLQRIVRQEGNDMNSKDMTEKDIEMAKRIPERWTALGAIGFPSATARRLVRLGLVERRLARAGMARMWDYRRVTPNDSSADTASKR